MNEDKYMTLRWATLFAGLVLVVAGSVVSIAGEQQSPGPTTAVQLIGLAGVKDGAKGTMSVENGNLHFVHRKATSDVSATSIEDVVTGGDSQKAVGKTIGMISMAAPYGGGRFLSLFRTKIDTLTIRYRDADGGLHGAIFTMPVGKADGIKKELQSTSAHSAPGESSEATSKSVSPSSQEERKLKTWAIQVEMIESDEVSLPAEFQVALYENLIRQLEKQGFQHVYRGGDRNATGIANLVVLHSTVRGFKEGSERARQVTTVSGATSITVHCQFSSPDGTSLLERDVNGKVRFFGGNLKATYDFAKKAARVAHENLFSLDHE